MKSMTDLKALFQQRASARGEEPSLPERPPADPARIERAKREAVQAGLPKVLESFGVPSKFLSARLTDFSDDLTQELVRHVKAGRGLHLFGLCGRGKTHLAVALLADLVRPYIRMTGYERTTSWGERTTTGLNSHASGPRLQTWELQKWQEYLDDPGATARVACRRNLLFVNIPGLLRKLRLDNTHREADGPLDRIGAVVSADVAVLDDIGSARLTEYAQDVQYELINGRYEANRLTITTSNYSLEELPGRIGEPAADRLAELASPVRLKGRNHRIPPVLE